MVFSNFGAPLYEGFYSNVTVDGEEFNVEFIDLKDNGDLDVKITLPLVDGDKEGDNIKTYTLKPEDEDDTFNEMYNNLDIDLEAFLNKLTVNTEALEAALTKDEDEDEDEDKDYIDITINHPSDTKGKTYKFYQDSSNDAESSSTTQASTTQASTTQASTTQASNNKASNKKASNKKASTTQVSTTQVTTTQASNKKDGDNFKDYNDEEDSDDDEDDEDEDNEDEDDEDDINEPFMGNRIEGFNGTGNRNNRNTIAHNFNMKLLLKSLLFSCLFYLLAHSDTRNTLLKVLKVDKEYYLYLGTAIFFIIYLILNILI